MADPRRESRGKNSPATKKPTRAPQKTRAERRQEWSKRQRSYICKRCGADDLSYGEITQTSPHGRHARKKWIGTVCKNITACARRLRKKKPELTQAQIDELLGYEDADV